MLDIVFVDQLDEEYFFIFEIESARIFLPVEAPSQKKISGGYTIAYLVVKHQAKCKAYISCSTENK